MIDPKEIRIGNLLYPKLNTTPHWRMALRVSMIGEKIKAGYFEAEPDSFQPIPLDDEWLNKFSLEEKWYGAENGPGDERCYGFKLSDHLFLVKNMIRDGSGRWDGYHLVYRSGVVYRIAFGKKIEHVHHLQNIVLGLTGQELTLKDPT